MTREERAAGLSTVDLGEGFKFTPEDLDDDEGDRDELISSDIAAGMTTVDLGEWSEPLPDADDLVSSDLAAAALGLGYGVLVLFVVVGVLTVVP